MKTESTINLLQISLFERTVADIPDSLFWEPGAGHGHTPVWLLGHLAIVGELGQQMLGGALTHEAWLPHFVPGSQDPIQAEQSSFCKSELVPAVVDAYQQLRSLYDTAASDLLQRPHQVALFQGTPIQTLEHATALLLTNHFAFHLAQLSSIRRSAGHPPLF